MSGTVERLASGRVVLPERNAGATLRRLLEYATEGRFCRGEVKVYGETGLPDGRTSYSLGVILDGGEELHIDVEGWPAPVSVSDDCPASKMDEGVHEDSFAPDGEPRTCGWCCQEWTPGSDGRPAP